MISIVSEKPNRKPNVNRLSNVLCQYPTALPNISIAFIRMAPITNLILIVLDNDNADEIHGAIN